ncbi:hypothetical protein RD055328_08510 [Companilactobacillus sp. RD055328]|uniref:hypothetical protein n=1 Tax=Companilactobacillus sp. RD055328 TaxID=2916634 RepID=UPI001FC85538|nr:hypothetical protein [Companilactobacillus sp. RD055328]GKQ42928.1 hypothetical protein RD055328_08510 [Companilactobacillus sp. RD055328]
MRIIELTKGKLKYLEESYRDYVEIDYLIAHRILELDHPWKEPEDNIGGGRSSIITKLQEQIVVRHDEDKQLQRLINLQKAGDRAIKRLDDEQLNIFKLKFKETNYYDWETIGELIHVSKPTIYRKRYKLLEILGKELGIC